MGNFLDLARRLAALKTEARNTARTHFETEMKEFMARFPHVAIFSFIQYTPSFNDGDPCHNYLSGPWVILDTDRDTFTGLPNEEECSELSDPEYAELRGAINELQQEDLLELAYGTNRRVTARRVADGSTVVESDYYDGGY